MAFIAPLVNESSSFTSSFLGTSAFHNRRSRCTKRQHYSLDNYQPPSRRTPCKTTNTTNITTATRTTTRACATKASGNNGVGADSMSDADRKQYLLDVLSEIQDPDLHQNIVSLGFIKNLEFSAVPGLKGMYDVKFDVELTTPACPIKDAFQTDCQRLAEGVPWIGKATVTMTAQTPGSGIGAGVTTTDGASVFDYVNSIIAVASCKGGVGKSTTAVNLAWALKQQGARVGILDADIYGPSLPTLVTPEDPAVQFRDGRIQPLQRDGVKLMSFGYINPDTAVMRGPMIASMLNQIATTTQWGALDYLILDMPPGTGDIQLTAAQILKIDAAVIVTTPQKLAFVDVVKGIDMFDKVGIPSVAVVENMAFFRAPDTGKKHMLFGDGHRKRLEQEYGFQNVFDMPLVPELCESSDKGNPFMTQEGESEVAERYGQVAGCIAREVAKIKHGGLNIPEVKFDENSGFIVVKKKKRKEEDKEIERIWPADLRRKCRCAVCVDEMTGRVRLDPASVADDIKPLGMRVVGNYALEIIWSDNHPSLYPYARFVSDWHMGEVGRGVSDARDPGQAERVGGVGVQV